MAVVTPFEICPVAVVNVGFNANIMVPRTGCRGYKGFRVIILENQAEKETQTELA